MSPSVFKATFSDCLDLSVFKPTFLITRYRGYCPSFSRMGLWGIEPQEQIHDAMCWRSFKFRQQSDWDQTRDQRPNQPNVGCFGVEPQWISKGVNGDTRGEWKRNDSTQHWSRVHLKFTLTHCPREAAGRARPNLLQEHVNIVTTNGRKRGAEEKDRGCHQRNWSDHHAWHGLVSTPEWHLARLGGGSINALRPPPLSCKCSPSCDKQLCCANHEQRRWQENTIQRTWASPVTVILRVP